MSPKFLQLTMTALLATAAAGGSRAAPTSPLPEKELIAALDKATPVLRRAFAAAKKTDSVQVREDHSAWQLQCLMVLSADNKSPLWRPCLAFSSYMFNVADNEESVELLLPILAQQPVKYKAVVAQLSEKEQANLQLAVESAKAMQNYEGNDPPKKSK